MKIYAACFIIKIAGFMKQYKIGKKIQLVLQAPYVIFLVSVKKKH